MAGRRRLGSVQEQLPFEDIIGDAVVLRDGDLRAVLRTDSLNFALKSEAEQEAILAAYRHFLNGLSFPLQILVRVVPTDVERYLAGLRQALRRHADGMLMRLARDHEAFVRQIARERTLLDRRFYVVVPAGRADGASRTRLGPPWRVHREGVSDEERLAARRRLAFRCAEVEQGLAAVGVRAQRLEAPELAALWRDLLGGSLRPTPSEPLLASPVVTRAPRAEDADA